LCDYTELFVCLLLFLEFLCFHSLHSIGHSSSSYKYHIVTDILESWGVESLFLKHRYDSVGIKQENVIMGKLKNKNELRRNFLWCFDQVLLTSFACLIRLIVSVAWVAHIIIYLLIDPPLSPFLNEVFIKLDDIWGNFLYSCLFVSSLLALCSFYLVILHSNMFSATLPGLLGTVAFAFFCFYLLLAVIAGAMMLGLRLVFITIHPMK